LSMDLELADWRTDWMANEVSDAAMLRPDLRSLVDRKRRRMRLVLAGQLLYSVAMLIFSAWFASRRPTLEWILWAAVLWVAVFSAVGFTLWNKAGTWRAIQQSNAAFLDLSRRRCLRELQATHLGRWSLAVQLAIVAPWLSWDFAIHRLPLVPYLFGMAVAIVVAAVFLASFTARERRTVRELQSLDQFAEQAV
jgi:drug/metabolite transporter (DMT)-like permease